MNKIILITALLLANICSAFAGAGAVITVHVTDLKLSREPLKLILLREYIYYDLGTTEISATADQHGSFSFKIPRASTYKFFQLEFDNLRFLSGRIEEGDRIDIRFSGSREKYFGRNDYHISGKGSARINLSCDLMKHHPSAILKLRTAAADDQEKLTSLLQKADAIYLERLAILKTYQGRVSKDVYQYYHAEIYGAVYKNLLSFFSTNKTISLDSARIRYLMKEADSKLPVLDPKVTAQSAEYLDYLLSKSANVAHYTRRINRADAYEATFEELIAGNSGILREKALLVFIFKDTRYRYSKNAAAVYQKVLTYMKDKHHRQLVEDIAFRRKSGTKAFDFSLTGINGDTVHLHDFKNKVVLIEGWFVGCESCIELAKKMKNKVLPLFINNPDVVFINMNVDASKERWLSALKEGEYSNSKSINVYTSGLGTNHPLLKYYHMQGMPQLLLVGKDGNLISTDIRGTAEEITEKIRLALLDE